MGLKSPLQTKEKTMEKIRSMLAIATLMAGASVSPVQAQVVAIAQGAPSIASYHSRGMCLDVRASDSAVLLWTCHGGSNQAFRFVRGGYGLISLGNQQCLTGGRKAGSGLTARTCNSSDQNQKWGFQPDGSLRNEASLCADIEGGGRSAGTRIISWNCNSGAGNQKWYPAVTTSRITLGIQSLSAISGRGPVQGIVSTSGFSGSNLVAAGGGNLVAAGGGNMVAAGGGNIVAGGAGQLIAAGGGNLVAAGGGNAVPTNGGNLLPRNWSFFNSLNAGNLVGNDGASFGQ